MKTTGKFVAQAVLLALCAGCATRGAWALEAAEGYTPEKIQGLVKDLASQDFAKRREAEKELSKAGPKAQAALKAVEDSPDAEVKRTVKRLLGMIKLATLAPVNYLDVLPLSATAGLYVENAGILADNAQKTALGKLVFSQALEPLRKKLEAKMKEDPDAPQNVQQWLGRFKGQFAAGAWGELNMMGGEMKSGGMLEITAADPKAVYAELLELGIVNNTQQKTQYKDVEMLESEMGLSVALAGKHLLFGSNVESLKELIDNLLAPTAGFNGSPAYAKLKPKLGPRPEIIIFLDMQAYLKALAGLPFPGLDEILTKSGAKDTKFAMFSSATAGDAFEDRYVTLMENKPAGFRSAVQAPEGVNPLEAMALIPANAVGAGVGYMDGSKMYAACNDYLGALKNIMEFQKQMNPNAPAMDFDALLKNAEAKTGLKFADVFGNIKGEFGYWLVLAPPPGLAPPDVGLLLTCADAEKAKATSAAIAKAIAAVSGDMVTAKETPYRNTSIFQVDLAPLTAGAMPNVPVSPCWAVDGNRIFVSSSTKALQKQLVNNENKAPGLLTQPEFVKAMGSLRAEERKGQVVYGDIKALLTMGATLGLPLLQGQITDADMKAALAALPAPQELFKDFPPLLLSMVDQGETSLTILRAPVPPIPAIIGLILGGSAVKSAQGMQGPGF